jgi:uncharacterized membrane protein
VCGRQLDSRAVGDAHWISASGALIAAALVFASRKGTRFHRNAGWTYVLAMLTVNVTALSVYQMSGRWGPFHWLALVSLATLGAGLAPALHRPGGRRRAGWLGYHSHLMAWSAIGLACAGVSQLAVQFWPGWFAVVAATALTMLAGRLLIRRALPGAARRAAAMAGDTSPGSHRS